MAGFSVTNLQASVPVGSPLTQPEQSPQLPTERKAHLTTSNGVKSGVLRIGVPNGQSRVYRDHALRLRSQKGEAFQQMSAQIKNHFQQAYQGHVSPKPLEQLIEQLDVYLTQRQGGMGTPSFLRMVDAFERGRQEQARLEGAGARTLDGAVPWAAGRSKFQIKIDNMASGLRRILGAQDQPDVQTLGKGAVAQAFWARQVGQDRVFALPNTGGAPQIPRSDWRHGEMAAATARAKFDHVVRPESFLLLVSRDVTEQRSHSSRRDQRVTLLQGPQAQFSDLQAYEVPASSLEQFMQNLPEGARVEQAAVRMPLASGNNIHELTRGAPLSTAQCQQLQAGLYMAVDQMHACGLVHRDIKPANVMMDGDGRVKVVDLGSTEAVDAQGRAPASIKGYTEAYVRPDLLWDDVSADGARKQPVAADAGNDRYACAMTLITALVPGLDLANPDGRMALKAFHATRNAPPGSFGAKFVDELMAGARKFASEPAEQRLDGQSRQKSADPKAILQASVAHLSGRLQAEPGLRQSLEQMFNACLPGEAGNAAWEQLRAGALATASLPDSERKALNQLEMDRAVDRHLAANPDMLPGEATRLRELARQNISGNHTLSAEDAQQVVAQAAQVAGQQGLASRELIFGGIPPAL